MEFSKKLVLVPYSGFSNNENINLPTSNIEVNESQSNSKENIKNILTLCIQLAKANTYDEKGRITINGNLENTSILEFIQKILSQNIINVEDDFLDILTKADIDPMIITNETIKNQLIGYKNKKIVEDKNKIPDKMNKDQDIVKVIKRKDKLKINKSFNWFIP